MFHLLVRKHLIASMNENLNVTENVLKFITVNYFERLISQYSSYNETI